MSGQEHGYTTHELSPEQVEQVRAIALALPPLTEEQQDALGEVVAQAYMHRVQAEARAARGEPCEWFALCDRPAEGTMPHPTLGLVPICERCRAKVEAAR